jgi:hypothetical protein
MFRGTVSLVLHCLQLTQITFSSVCLCYGEALEKSMRRD